MTNEIVKQDNNVAKYTDKQIQLIHDTYAKNTTKEEFELYMYTAGKFQLDPLLKQIWCVKYQNQPAMIYAGRDGFLEIAHRSGQFNGLESGMKDDITAYAKVYRKDMQYPFYVEVALSEYSTGMALWKSKPKTMLTKVAESQALRRAFSISGVYGEEEMGQWELQAQGITFEPVKAQAISQGQQQSDFDWSKLDLDKEPNKKWNDKTKKYDVPMVKRLWAIKNKLNISNDDFHAKCVEITGKEHSKDWVNRDCMLVDIWLKEYENIKVEPEPDDIENASIDEFMQMEAEYNEVNK